MSGGESVRRTTEAPIRAQPLPHPRRDEPLGRPEYLEGRAGVPQLMGTLIA